MTSAVSLIHIFFSQRPTRRS